MKAGAAWRATSLRSIFFILQPSSFILSSVSAQKLLNVRVVGLPQGFVSPAKDDIAFTKHHDFTINETEPFAFSFEHHLALLIYHCIFGAEISHVVHFMGDEN
jgi:hypothetical protein